MFRFALATFGLLALFSGVAKADPSGSCANPVILTDTGGNNPIDLGGQFQASAMIENAQSVAGAFELWYQVTVAGACKLTIGFETCQGGVQFSTITMDIFETQDCGAAPLSGTASGQANCNNPLDWGATAFILDGGSGEKTYWVRVVSDNLAGLDQLMLSGSVTNLGSCGGDPHFHRWQTQVRDSFHGECDLVLLHQDEVAGKDLDVHVRTTMYEAFSYVSGVAFQYGKDTVEFEHDAMYINGVNPEDESRVILGDGIKIVMVDPVKRKFNVMVADQVMINVRSTKIFMDVGIEGVGETLTGSEGILGDYKTGDMISRHGAKMDNFMDFGFEWQVSPSDPQIFKDARAPQLPYERCRMPSVTAESRRRKLRGQDRKLYDQAVAACEANNKIPENIQTCVEDVMLTGELELANVF